MRAIVYAGKGPSDVLRLAERPVPEPGPGQVRVRMVRAGVNPTDWKERARMSSPAAFAEVTPGQDGAGVIDAVGTGVPGLAPGDRVWLYLGQHGLPYGTAAEYCVLDWQRAVPLPRSLADEAAFDLGACLGVPAVTAHQALTSGPGASRLGPGSLAGQVVLVHGGAGAVGNAAIQLAVWSGATVLTTVSSADKAALATAAGAHHIVNYRAEDAAAAIRRLAPDGVDLIAEVSPAVNNELDLSVARSDDRDLRQQRRQRVLRGHPPHVLPQPAVSVPAALHPRPGPARGRGAGRHGGRCRRRAASRDQAGLPLHRYPLAETAAAHDAVEQGAVGKVLIHID